MDIINSAPFVTKTMKISAYEFTHVCTHAKVNRRGAGSFFLELKVVNSYHSVEERFVALEQVSKILQRRRSM